MVDPHTHSYAGIYEWRTADAARAYLDVLLPVLRAVSVRGSVLSELHPEEAKARTTTRPSLMSQVCGFGTRLTSEVARNR